MKRVFGKLSKNSHGKHRISDTPENARDLEWFLGRYELEVADTERLWKSADLHREREAFVDAIIRGQLPAQAFDLAIPARDYQKQAAAMLLARGGLLLGDDVGLGKTASAIAALTDPRTRPAVVVTLTHLPRQWRAELARFAPGLRVHIAKKGSPDELTKSPKQMSLVGGFPDVVILNYHKLGGWAETLAKVCNSVVWDECQELRKAESGKYKAAKHLADGVQFRMGLSATPIYNYGGEFYNVLGCIFPNELGTRAEFMEEWCSGWSSEKATIKDPKSFGSYLRSSGMMLRRTRHDVGRELPPIQIIPHTIDADPEALNRVSASCAELARFILQGASQERGDKMRAAEELSNKLRQATGISKAPYVAAFVRMLLESEEPVVLYGWHHEVYRIWQDLLKDFKPVLYTGEQSIPQKEEAKRKFVAGETNLFLISLRSGAGLDGLQHRCRTVVFGELDWSPGVHEQCIGRVARDGQPDSVAAYYLLSETGSDPIVSEVLGVKRQQIEGVRQAPGDEDVIEKLQTDGSHVRRLAEAYLNSKRSDTA